MTTYLIIAGVVLVLGVGAAGYWYVRRPKPEEPIYHFNCPNCKRRLGYKARQVGHSGACPLCRKPFVFPPLGAEK